VVLVPRPVADEIDGLRRACGDGTRERVSPHLTLVPPVNVSENRVGEALQVLRHAAGAVHPFDLDLGPVASFAPDSPTLYLSVGGPADALETLHRLRDAVFRTPLHRSLTWPFVPHVTVADEMDGQRMDAAIAVLADFRVRVRCEAVHLLIEHRDAQGTKWTPFADYRLGARHPVARGGIPLELWVSSAPDPEARLLLGSWQAASLETGWAPITVTARRREELVAVATGSTNGARGCLDTLFVAPGHRGEGIARHLWLRFVEEAGPTDRPTGGERESAS
jgi:2'-5' RNA ligase/GNAT superfamily N-acetyltransferase